MLRILLLIIVGGLASLAILRTIAAAVVLVIDMRKGGSHAPEILGTLTGSFVIALVLGWLWKNIYFRKKLKQSKSPTQQQ